MTTEALDLSSADSIIESESSVVYGMRAYLEYSMSVNKGRALPFAQDGLKPVHRRFLHAMNQLNLTPNSPPAKSARVVGEVIGKYHPHGDVSVYEAIVKSAQKFSFRYPIVDGQGNFGSRDGDGAAAMRYTEVRLTKYADLYLDELKKGTVDWVPNYDGSIEEPKITPARLPMLLANGSFGIGVGMSSSIPSHNLKELAAAAVFLIKNKEATTQDLLEHIKGPDLPCGAQIISSQSIIEKVYESGQGALTARAIYHFEELSRGQWQLVFDEIPPEASVASVMSKIEDLLNPKVKKGEKSLDQRQTLLKQLSSSLIENVRDESGKDYELRLVITPQSSKIDREALVSLLLKNTDLESNVSFNMVAVDGNGAPRSTNLIGLLSEWIMHRLNCITRRTQSRLDDVLARLHILEGQQIVFLNIDEVIQIIRTSEDAKQALMDRFSLTELQANNILDMRLRQLANLEGIRIEQEITKLNAEKDELKELLNDPNKMRRLMIKEIEADAEKYGDERRTLMLPSAPVNIQSSSQPTVADEPLTIIISSKGWIRSRQGHDVDTSGLTFKEGDSLQSLIKCRSTEQLIFISDSGRTFSTLSGLIQGGRGDGVPINSIIDLQSPDKVLHIISGKDDTKVLLATSNGFGFICSIGNMVAKNKAGKSFMTVKDGGKILEPVILPPKSENQMIVSANSGRKLLAFPLDQMKILAAGGQGVTIMGLNDSEYISAIGVASKHEPMNLISSNNKKTTQITITLSIQEKYIGSRARKGCLDPAKDLITKIEQQQVPAS